MAERLDRDELAERQFGGPLRSFRAESLSLLGAVDAVQPDAYGAIVAQYFYGVTVKDGNDLAGEVGKCWRCKEHGTEQEGDYGPTVM